MYNNINEEELWGKPPPGYIPGISRGGTGITGGVSRKDAAAANEKYSNDDDYTNNNFFDDDRDFSVALNNNLFGSALTTKEDNEADEIYTYVDTLIGDRRRKHRNRTIEKELKKNKNTEVDLSNAFSNQKKELENVTFVEWADIPDIGVVGKSKQVKYDRITRIPNTIKVSKDYESYNTLVNVNDEVVAGNTYDHDYVVEVLANSRFDSLSNKLEQSTNFSSIIADKQAYLNNLDLQAKTTRLDTAEQKKIKILLNNLMKVNSNDPNVYIMSAEYEMNCGRIHNARNIAALGCSKCPKSLSMWVLASELFPKSDKLSWLQAATEFIKDSEELWIKLIDVQIEQNKDMFEIKNSFDTALTAIPNSNRLWEKAIDYEPEATKAILLKKALKVFPSNTNLWISLIRHTDDNKIEKVIQSSAKYIDNSIEIWLEALKLEINKKGTCVRLLEIAINHFNDIESNRVKWLTCISNYNKDEVEIFIRDFDIQTNQKDKTTQYRFDEIKKVLDSNSEMSICVASYLLKNLLENNSSESAWVYLLSNFTDFLTLDYSVVLKNELNTNIFTLIGTDDKEKYLFNNIAVNALSHNINSINLWSKYLGFVLKEIDLYKNMYQDSTKIFNLLSYMQDNVNLIYMLIKLARKIIKNKESLDELRDYLSRSNKYSAILSSMPVVKQYIYLLNDICNFELAEELINNQLNMLGFNSSMFKSTNVDLEAFENIESLLLVMFEIKLISIQWKMTNELFQTMKNACIKMKTSIKLWQLLLYRVVLNNQPNNARAIYYIAQNYLKNVVVLTDIECYNEYKTEKDTIVQFIQKELKKLPISGLIYKRLINYEDQNNKAKVLVNALKITENDVYVLLAAVLYFLSQNQYEKAYNWLIKAKDINSNNGDVMIEYYIMLVLIKNKLDAHCLTIDNVDLENEISTAKEELENTTYKIGIYYNLIFKPSEEISFNQKIKRYCDLNDLPLIE